MGNDPEVDDFIAGNTCAAFEAAFGTTETPEFLLFTASGMVKCPGNPVDADPAAAVLLTQVTGVPCAWNATISPFFYQVDFGADELAIIFVEGTPFRQAFFGQGIQDAWANEKVCPGIPSVQWSGGTARIEWGPHIEP